MRGVRLFLVVQAREPHRDRPSVVGFVLANPPGTYEADHLANLYSLIIFFGFRAAACSNLLGEGPYLETVEEFETDAHL